MISSIKQASQAGATEIPPVLVPEVGDSPTCTTKQYPCSNLYPFEQASKWKARVTEKQHQQDPKSLLPSYLSNSAIKTS